MQVLALSGEGPYFKNSDYLTGSLFDRDAAASLESTYASAGVNDLRLENLCYEENGARRPLMRSKRGLVPHLTSFTLDSILRSTQVDYELFRLEHVWNGDREPRCVNPDIVLLSTTLICERHTLAKALSWVADRFPGALIVLGGQYSNLKYARILKEHPSVEYVVRGDGERALPALLAALRGRGNLADVPNLVTRCEGNSGRVRATRLEYVDLANFASPSFPGSASIIPYESMRGCPFSCGFCSFPLASPQWRYKSATKIVGDWQRYARDNGARHIRAMDSTFTVPPSRLRELLRRLPAVPVTWEAYARANNLKDGGTLGALAAAGCTTLSIGFESMSDRTLAAMDKRVTAGQNCRAFDLLNGSSLDYRISFMVGYPGETPDDYEETHRFLLEDYVGHCMLSIFSFLDETMPVWSNAERFGLEILDRDNPDYAWRHDGMDVETARSLLHRTLDEVRRHSESAIVLLWQTDYHTPLFPRGSRATNLRLEKLVDRLGMIPRDHPTPERAAAAARSLLAELAEYGVTLSPERAQLSQRPAVVDRNRSGASATRDL